MKMQEIRHSGDRWDRWMRGLSKSTSAVVLPFLMTAIHNMVAHLKFIDISLVSLRGG